MDHNNKHIKLSVILPTFNEKENVILIYNSLKNVMDQLTINYEIIFVDDNSPDGTIDVVKSLHQNDKNVKYILMARRFGDQVSLMAGLDHTSGDIVVTMDSDLQHPPAHIPVMLEKWKEGYDVVIAIREKEGHNSLFKKMTELIFYKMMNILSDTKIYNRFSGFCLLDGKVVRELRKYKEKEPFLRGLIPLVGFKTIQIYYKEMNREYGESKYSILRMFKLAISGIVSFSSKPLYIAFYSGVMAVFMSLLYGFYVVISEVFFKKSVPGWASVILLIIFFGGLQLISMGLLGIYLSKVFMQTKDRPNYIISEIGGIIEKSDECHSVQKTPSESIF